MNQRGAVFKKGSETVTKITLLREGIFSIPPFYLARKSTPILVAMKMPDAKAAVDKEWDKLKNLLAWEETKGER